MSGSSLLYHFSLVIVIICSPKIFFLRHQRLHKIIFEEDGLPDGAVVAYYARGQVVSVCISCTSYCMHIALLSVDCYILIDRNCSRVSKVNLEFFVNAVALRCLYLLFSCMLVGTP